MAHLIQIVRYDPLWPHLFKQHASKIRHILGDAALSIEHVGSTSVPGLAAKPTVDIVLVVHNAANEPKYLPALEQAGYLIRIREPHWYEHRMFEGGESDVNLHVFSKGCPEIDRMLLFRNWLRSNEVDRKKYEFTKQKLASQKWNRIQDYADAKTAIVNEILNRASHAS